MSEAEQAWRLWHLLQECSEQIWQRYEEAFMDFCGEECSKNAHERFADSDESPF
jgi:hypothetical protein